MARSVSRKSTKKCPSGKIARKSHMRAGKRVKATCVKRRTMRKMKSLTMAAPKSTRRMRKTSHQKCVSRKAKAMHKKASTKRQHQKALGKANKACAKK